MSNAVQQAIAQAQQNAGAIVDQPANTNVAPSGAQASLADFSNVAAVDVWLKVKEGGLFLGDDLKVHETLTFHLDLAEVDTFYSATWNVGGNPFYEKSRDRIISESGRPWGDVLRDASRQAGRSVRDFVSATLPLQMISSIKGRTSTVEEGATVGYTLPYTGSQEFAKLLKKLAKEGWDTTQGVYEITLSSLPSKNGQGNSYGRIQFDDVKPVDE